MQHNGSRLNSTDANRSSELAETVALQTKTHFPDRADGSHDLPVFLKRQSVTRLRFLSGFMCALTLVVWLIPLIYQNDLEHEFSHIFWWGPESLIVIGSLVVFIVSRREEVTDDLILNIALAYEVIVSFAIVFAQYWGRLGNEALADLHLDDLLGFSYLSGWMLFFTIFVPNRPSGTLSALLASLMSLPAVYAMSELVGETPVFTPTRFAVGFVFPSLCCGVVPAYLAARMMHQMGTAVKEAREMGSYRLVSRIGRGGMGEVWKAEHRMLARPAAVKFIRNDSLNSANPRNINTTIDRFDSEAQATAGLRSPHIVELYDYGRTEEGTFYYVMELLDGIDLQNMVHRFGPLPAERVIHYLEQACHALGEAHENSLIHRDIKPANLFICQFGRDLDFLKILDFGLVQLSSDASANATLRSRVSVEGTPGYVAPEILSRGAEADRRTDIYSIGCLAYWLLVGQQVFDTQTLSESVRCHIEDVPQPPSERTGLSVPDQLEELVLRCLEKNPDNRPQSADELLSLLRACELSSKWTVERATKWWAEHRLDQPISTSDK